jgi:two-component system LytT family response regulator
VLVVDDEPLARERIAGLLEERVDVELIAECANGREAVDVIRSEEPDVVFLDVQMPGMNGLEVLAALAPDPVPAVVFVTAYEAHAVQAFELHALDYLLKPFEDRRFDEALRRARARVDNRRLLSDFAERVAALLQETGPMSSVLPERAAAASEAPLEWLVVKDAERSVLLPVSRVDWIEAANYYSVAHAGTRTHVLRDSLARLERSLGDRFVRIHRSTIVNLDRVVEFQRLFHGDFAVILADGTDLKLSRTYRSLVEARLGRPI